MSAVMHLCKPLKGFEFVPAKKEDRLELVKASVTDDKYQDFFERTYELDELEYEKKYCGYFPGYDNNKHIKIEINYITNGWPRGRKRSRRLYKDAQYLRTHFKDYIIRCNYYNKIIDTIIAEEVLYGQGWFFKKSFMQKCYTANYAFDKAHLKNLLENILDFKCVGRDGDLKKYALQAYREFTDKFEDGMIFYAVF